MKNNGRVSGSKEMAVPVYTTEHWVYVHTNIVKREAESDVDSDSDIYDYDEVQYSLSEYVQILTEQNVDIQMALIELAAGR